MVFTPKQWRCFGRCIDGLKKCRVKGKRIRFLTLTLPACNCVVSGVQSSLYGDVHVMHDNDGKRELIQKLWRVLYMRLSRLTSGDLLAMEYIDEADVNIYYDGCVDKKLIFDYFSVRTDEGNGVIHIVFSGDYIPFVWLMENWLDISGTNFIWINDPYKQTYNGRRVRNEYDVSMYLMSQYISIKQGNDFVYGYSHDWLYDGYCKDYVEMRKCCKNFDVDPVNMFGIEVYPIDYNKFRKKWDVWLMDRYGENIFRGVWDVNSCDGNKVLMSTDSGLLQENI